MKGKLYSNFSTSCYGVIGEFAFKYNGENYFVGDVVELGYCYNNIAMIVKDSDGISFVMGCKGQTYNGNARGLENIGVKKIKNYTELEDGEKVDSIIVKLDKDNTEIEKESQDKLKAILDIIEGNQTICELGNLFDRVAQLSDVDSKSLVETGLKCAEEVGEMSQAILSHSNTCGCGYKGLNEDDVAEEAVDVIIVALSAIKRSKGKLDINDVVRIMNHKLDKWEEKIRGDK